jgi:hypothetical protein
MSKRGQYRGLRTGVDHVGAGFKPALSQQAQL